MLLLSFFLTEIVFEVMNILQTFPWAWYRMRYCTDVCHWAFFLASCAKCESKNNERLCVQHGQGQHWMEQTDVVKHSVA